MRFMRAAVVLAPAVLFAGCGKSDSAPPVAKVSFTTTKPRVTLGSPVELTYRFDVGPRAAIAIHGTVHAPRARIVADFGGTVRVAITGAGPGVFRQADMEKALSAKFAPESVASIKVKADGLNNDLHASPEYRAHLTTVMAKRAVEAALK